MIFVAMIIQNWNSSHVLHPHIISHIALLAISLSKRMQNRRNEGWQMHAQCILHLQSVNIQVSVCVCVCRSTHLNTYAKSIIRFELAQYSSNSIRIKMLNAKYILDFVCTCYSNKHAIKTYHRDISSSSSSLLLLLLVTSIFCLFRFASRRPPLLQPLPLF